MTQKIFQTVLILGIIGGPNSRLSCFDAALIDTQTKKELKKQP